MESAIGVTRRLVEGGRDNVVLRGYCYCSWLSDSVDSELIRSVVL